MTEQSHLWNGMDIPIIGLTGPKTSGKTLWASTIDPERTLIIDCELSSATYSTIPYGDRMDLFEELQKQGKEPTPLNAWILVRDKVESADPQKIRVVVVDTWDFIQQGFVDWVRANPEKFNHTKGQYEKMSGMMWGDAKGWLHMWLGMQAKRLRGTFVLINHLGLVWRDGKPTRKDKAKGLDTIYQLASLYLRLERPVDNSGKMATLPTGITAEVAGGKSRLVKQSFKGGKLELVPILPPQIPDCTPDKIREYIGAPAGAKKSLSAKEKYTPAPMTEEEKLQVEAEIAENQKEAAQAKLSQMELMAEAGRRQAAAEQVAVPKVESPVETLATPEQSPADPTPPAEPEPDIYDQIEEQRVALGITDDAWLGTVLAKRGAKTVRDLTLDDAKEMHGKLHAKLTARDMGEQ